MKLDEAPEAYAALRPARGPEDRPHALRSAPRPPPQRALDRPCHCAVLGRSRAPVAPSPASSGGPPTTARAARRCPTRSRPPGPPRTRRPRAVVSVTAGRITGTPRTSAWNCISSVVGRHAAVDAQLAKAHPATAAAGVDAPRGSARRVASSDGARDVARARRRPSARRSRRGRRRASAARTAPRRPARSRRRRCRRRSAARPSISGGRVDQPELVAQPLNRARRSRRSSPRGRSWSARRDRRRRSSAARGSARSAARVEQQEGSRSRRCSSPRRPSKQVWPNSAACWSPTIPAIGRSRRMPSRRSRRELARGADLRQHRAGDAHQLEARLVPVERVQVHQHRPAGIGRIGRVDAAPMPPVRFQSSQLSIVPKASSPFSARARAPVDVLEQPPDLGAREVGRERQPDGLAQAVGPSAPRARARASACGCPARRSRCGAARPSPDPRHGRLALVGDPDRRDARRPRRRPRRALRRSPRGCAARPRRGSCSTQPARGWIWRCSRWSTRAIRPSRSNRISRVLVVPWSIAAT